MSNCIRFLLAGVIVIALAIPVAVTGGEKPFGGKGRPGMRKAQGVPKVVLDGLKEYRRTGADAALQIWLKGGPFETRQTEREKASAFQKLEKAYGKFHGHEVLTVKSVGNSVRNVYMTLRFEKGPLFANFLTYNNGTTEGIGRTTDAGWVVVSIDLNTEPEGVIPAWLMEEMCEEQEGRAAARVGKARED